MRLRSMFQQDMKASKHSEQVSPQSPNPALTIKGIIKNKNPNSTRKQVNDYPENKNTLSPQVLQHLIQIH